MHNDERTKKKKNERSSETLTIDEHDLTVSYSNNEDLFSLWWLIMIGILVLSLSRAVFSSDDKYQKKRLGHRDKSLEDLSQIGWNHSD